MPKMKEAQPREQLADLRLKASLAATNYSVTSDFHQTPQQKLDAQHAAEFRELQMQEQAELEAARKKEPAFVLASQQWNRPSDDLVRNVGTLTPDFGAAELLPLTDQPIGDITKTFADFKDLIQSRGIALTRSGINRLVTYMNLASRSVIVKNGVEHRVACDQLQAWVLADRRLCDLSDTYATEERAELIPEEASAPAQTSADDLRAAAEEKWSRFPLWHAWEQSLSDGFNVKLSDNDRRRVCDMFVSANLSPYAAESYNTVRQMLVARERFPLRPNGEPALTVDERMAQLTENYNLSNPAERRAWCHEIGRLKAILGE
jgi:hypothetical protein